MFYRIAENLVDYLPDDWEYNDIVRQVSGQILRVTGPSIDDTLVYGVAIASFTDTYKYWLRVAVPKSAVTEISMDEFQDELYRFRIVFKWSELNGCVEYEMYKDEDRTPHTPLLAIKNIA